MVAVERSLKSAFFRQMTIQISYAVFKARLRFPISSKVMIDVIEVKEITVLTMMSESLTMIA